MKRLLAELILAAFWFATTLSRLLAKIPSGLLEWLGGSVLTPFIINLLTPVEWRLWHLFRYRVEPKNVAVGDQLHLRDQVTIELKTIPNQPSPTPSTMPLFYPPVELALSDWVALANDAIFAGTATHLDYSVLAANEAIDAMANAMVLSGDLVQAANDALAAANQNLVEAINLSFSDSLAFLDSVTLVPA